jgi:hypothetical protein
MASHKLQKLEPRHKAAVRLRVEGKSNDVISERLGIAKTTIERWWGAPLIKEELERVLSDVDAAFAAKLAGAGLEAIDQLVGLMNMRSAEEGISNHQKLEVARELLDRVPQAVKTKDLPQDAPAAQQNMVNVFANMDDAQLAAYVAKWSAGEPDVIDA